MRLAARRPCRRSHCAPYQPPPNLYNATPSISGQVFNQLAILLRQLPSLVFVLDDTPTERYGRHVQGAGLHRNPIPGPSQSRSGYGHVWVTLALLLLHPQKGTSRDRPSSRRQWGAPLSAGRDPSLAGLLRAVCSPTAHRPASSRLPEGLSDKPPVGSQVGAAGCRLGSKPEKTHVARGRRFLWETPPGEVGPKVEGRPC